MDEIPVYLYRSYTLEGALYAYISGSEEENFQGFSSDIKGLAQGLVKVVQAIKKPFIPVWAIPPNKRDIIFPNSFYFYDTIDPKEKPRIAKAIVEEIVRALSGK